MSQFPIDEQLVERADYAYNPKPEGARILYACDCRKEVERLQEQVRVLGSLPSQDEIKAAMHLSYLQSYDMAESLLHIFMQARAALAATEERP